MRTELHKVIASLFILTFSLAPGEPLAARWEGSVEIPGDPLTVVIDLDQDVHGQWLGSAIFPGYGVKGAPLTDVVVSGSGVSFKVPNAMGGPSFRGQLADELLTGDYRQAGNNAPFTLKRSGSPQVEPPRRSTAVTKELEGEWQGDMTVMGNPIKVSLKLSNSPGRGSSGELLLVGRRRTTLAASLITQEGSMLTVEVFDANMTLEGQYRKAANEIAATYQQGPIEAVVILHPAAKDQ